MESRLFLLTYILVAFFPVFLSGQTVVDSYFQETGNFALIYNGGLENGYRYGYVNTPYYPKDYKTGSLCYKNVTYTNVSLRIDNYTCRLLVRSPDGKYNFPLNPQDINSICIDNRNYIYFSKDLNAPNDAYYMILHQTSDWGLYKLRYISNINKEYIDSKVFLRFYLKERIYLVINGKWSEINGRNSFISHFKQHKQELLHYCKQQHLLLNKDNEDGWIKLALYCDTLIK